MDERPKHRLETIKLLKENRGKLDYIRLDNDFQGMLPKGQATKTKIDNWNYIKLIQFLCIKGHNQQSEKATYRMGENICDS